MTSEPQAENISKIGWLDKAEKFFAWVSIFLFSWQWRHTLVAGSVGGEFFEYGSTHLYASDVAVIMLLGLWLANGGFRQIDFGPKTLLKPLLALLVWVTFSSWWSVAPILTAGAIWHWWLGFAWLVYLINRVKSLSEIFWPLLWGLVLQAMWGIAQFGFNGSLSWLVGRDILTEPVLDPSRAGVPVVVVDGVRQLRAHGLLPHANILGGLMAVAAAAGLYVSAKAQRWWWGLPIGIAVILSFSRGGWLALGLVFIIGAIALWRNRGAFNWFAIGALLIGIVGAGWWQYPAIASRFDLQDSLEARSVAERVESLAVWREAAKDNLWQGVGAGAYTQHLVAVFPNQPVWWYQPVHNSYLLVVGELGAIGLASLGWLVVAALGLAIQTLRRHPLKFLACAPLIVWLGVGLFDHWPVSLEQGRMLLFLALALIILAFNVSLKEIKT